MPETLPPPLVELRARTEAFIQNDLAPLEEILNAGEDRENVRERVVSASTKAELFKMTQPKSYSGDDVGAMALTVVRETLAAANLRVGRYVFAPGAGVLGDAEGDLREHYLDPLMRGEKRGSFGFTEPDNTPRPTWASQEADDIVVTGRKSFVTGGANADFVSALVNVERDAEGKGGLRWWLLILTRRVSLSKRSFGRLRAAIMRLSLLTGYACLSGTSLASLVRGCLAHCKTYRRCDLVFRHMRVG